MPGKIFEHYVHVSGTNTFDVPEGTVSIGENAFAEGEYLYTITLPDTVREIGKNAFANCVRLHNIRLPEGLVGIGEGAFQGCSHLDTPLPDSVQFIGERAFCDCWELRNIALSNLQSVGGQAFMRCSHLKTVSISGDSLSIGTDAFAKCISLRSARISTNAPFRADGLFPGCSALKEAVLPDSTVSMNCCFTGCSALGEFTIPGSLTEFDAGNFQDSGLRVLRLHSGIERVSFPENVTMQRLAAIEVSPDNPDFASVDNMLMDKKTGELLMYPPGAEVLRLSRDIRKGLDNAVRNCNRLRKLIITDCGKTLELNLSRGFRPELIPNIISGNYTGIQSNNIRIPLIIFDLDCCGSEKAQEMLRCRIKRVMEFIISSGNPDFLAPLLKYDIIPPERIDEFIAMAAENNCNEISLALLDHKNSDGGYSDILSQFSL